MIYRSFRFLLTAITLIVTSCSFYSLKSTSIPDNINSFQVNPFGYTATQSEVGIERTFTNKLSDAINDQTRLSLVAENGDYIYAGEVSRYFISPITATADNRASQNRLTIDIDLRFTNTKEEAQSFDKTYTFNFDFPANIILQNATLEEALNVIYAQIIQEITNDTLNAGWR